jgi:hypothetical protein
MNRKGISPLLSTVLLISISVLLAALLMSWSAQLTKSQQADISNKTGQALACTSADAQIKYVYLDFTSNKSRVIVQNTGLIDLNIVSARMMNNKGESVNLTNSSTLPLLIVRGDLKEITFNIGGAINACVNFSKVIVSMNCPIPVYFDTAPTCVS